MSLEIAVKDQRLAAHPDHSAWVAASAGSGKTKVLTDRVLNLLLEGCPPERILCLTFTKAAAAEMANRIRLKLGDWAIKSEGDLKKTLEDLQGSLPTPEKVERAQRLFGLALDAPGGLKIQTIHSFCQSLLKRFPLEAELSPFFEVANESQQKELIKRAFHAALKIPALQPFLADLILRFSETTLEDFNSFILQERLSFEDLTSAAIDEVLETKKLTQQGLWQTLLQGIPRDILRKMLNTFGEGSPSDQERGRALGEFLCLSEEKQKENAQTYLDLFLTQKGERRARLLTQKVADDHPALKTLLEQEATRLEMWLEKWNALEISALSKAFLYYGQAFLKAYENLKTRQSLLDYDDLILKTVALLKNPGCHWVLYKLDGGLDHILVDEAQDTSPSQWQVIRVIAEEFYANAAADCRDRTLFIVGDDKQSIYSFQGADPDVFSTMQKDLKAFALNSEKRWQDIDLTVSFRSTPEILQVVDRVFARKPLFEKPLEHLPYRKEAPGHVELWPLVEEDDEALLEPWAPPLQLVEGESPQKRLAHILAKTIHGWIFQESPLPKRILPGDILILVRRRTSFVDMLIRALKDYHVPVAGVDRLFILEGLGVQDLLKLAEFLLLPEDDLTLATVLKGPLFGMAEEDLFTLAYGRESTSLWQRLLKSGKFQEIKAVLTDLLNQVDFLTPFALFNKILGPLGGKKKWQACLGEEVLDSLNEFLNLCLTFQEKKTPSLQNFLAWVSQEVIELKRDLDQSNQVRVMTVHGSKGLQAPVVILPDTTQLPQDLPAFDIEDGALIWLPPQAKDIPLTRRVKRNLRGRQLEEYRRLLYVALTRAEDALYICGWGKEKPDSWYHDVREGLQGIGEDITFEGASPYDLQGKGKKVSSLTKYKTSLSEAANISSLLLPRWLEIPPPLEMPVKVVRPSDGEESSFEGSDLGAFGTQRGVLIHKLLEILPDVPEDQRVSAASWYLKQQGCEEEIIRDIQKVVMNVLQAFPDLFSSLSQGEVPFMGKEGERLISGQIDRLVVEEDHVLIIDYKSHIHVPQKIEDISLTYLTQMAIYKASLEAMYPQKTVRCALLWTEIPRLDFLPASLLKDVNPFIDGTLQEAYTEKNRA